MSNYPDKFSQTTCPYCGSNIVAKAGTCSRCGRLVNPDSPTDNEATIVSASRARPVPSSPPVRSSPASTSGGRKKLLWLLLVGGAGSLCLLCLGAGLLFFWLSNNRFVAEPNPVETEPAVSPSAVEDVLTFLREQDTVPLEPVEPLDPFAGPLPVSQLPPPPPIVRQIDTLNLVLGGVDTMQGVVEEITVETPDATTIPAHIQVEQGGDYILSGQIYDLRTASSETDNYLGGNLYVGIPLTEEQLQNATATNVGVIYFSAAGPQFIPGYLDTVESRVVFLTSHLSPYEPAIETPSAEIKRFIQEEATAMAFAAESKLEEVAFEAFKEYLNKFDNLDASTKALIQAAVMNNRDDIAAALTSSNPRDFQSVMASLNLAFGKAIADNVEESVLQGILTQVSGNPDTICTVAEAAGSAAGGDYWKAVEILGKSYSESIPAVQGAQMAIRLMQFGWGAWKQHEWQTAYDAYAKDEPWEVIIHTYGGITDYARDKFLKPDGSRMSLDEAEQLVTKLFDERRQCEAKEAVEARKLEAIYRDFQQRDKLTALAERLGMSRNPTTGKYDEPAVFRSYVSIYQSIARELTRLGLKRSWGAGDNWSPQIEARELFDAFVRDGAAAYHRKLAELEASTARSLAIAQACNLPPDNEAPPTAAVWILKKHRPLAGIAPRSG